MATLTLTVAAGDDDWATNESVNDTNYSGANAFNIGGVGNTPPAGYGYGFRFTGASALKNATINSAYMYLMKQGTQWANQDDRWAFEDADAPVQFDGTTNQPGDRTLVTSNIADESHNINHTDGVQYSFPTTGGLQTTLGANLQSVVNRSGYASVLAIIDNGDGDAGAYNNTSRKNWYCYESSVSNSEPQLVVDYTAAPVTAATMEQSHYRFYNNDGGEQTSTAKANEDATATEAPNVVLQLRVQLNVLTNEPDKQDFVLEYKKLDEVNNQYRRVT